mmetsp:Transcript_16177/g.15563  ORF Transcript_16177/g.15563 Transcript_16177/m.15563 type:complete len:104 (-) Transcript_16177:26-337(-)
MALRHEPLIARLRLMSVSLLFFMRSLHFEAVLELAFSHVLGRELLLFRLGAVHLDSSMLMNFLHFDLLFLLGFLLLLGLNLCKGLVLIHLPCGFGQENARLAA